MQGPRDIGDSHQHLVCRGCGRAEDTGCVVGERPCLEPADAQGFLIDEAEVIFWGLCPACQATRPPSRTTVTAAAPAARD